MLRALIAHTRKFLWILETILKFFLLTLPGGYDWAKNSLDLHRKDKRDHVYTTEQLEQAKTHDPLWNAAQVKSDTKKRESSTELPLAHILENLIFAVSQVDGNHQNWSLTRVVESKMANLWPQY